MRVDFHTHTTMSDGALSPAALLARAVEQGVSCLSITDHDTVAAYDGIEVPGGLTLVAGVELSCVWAGITVHVLGLGVDPASPAMRSAQARQAEARERRAQVIGERLARKGVSGAYAGARAVAGGGRSLGRPDFARFLVENGHVDSLQQAFDRYLGAGKLGDVKTQWPALAEAVSWICEGGGTAVLAHPLHYRLTHSKLRRLLVDFIATGGRGLEVVNGRQWTAQDLVYLKRYCRELGLQASIGSDFHQESPWSELGCDPALVGDDCVPVWRSWL